MSERKCTEVLPLIEPGIYMQAIYAQEFGMTGIPRGGRRRRDDDELLATAPRYAAAIRHTLWRGRLARSSYIQYLLRLAAPMTAAASALALLMAAI